MIVECYGSYNFSFIIVFTQFLLQVRIKFIPYETVVAVQDKPASVFGQLHVIDILIIFLQGGKFKSQSDRDIRTDTTVPSVQRQISACHGKCNITAASPLADLIPDYGPAVLGRRSN